MEKKKILITAALPYVNNLPHFGHIVGCHLPADVFYRFNKSIGNETYFVGGTDDHGTATIISSKEFDMKPEEFVVKVGDVARKIYEKLGISYSINTGTHTKIHEEITTDLFNHIYKNGYAEEKESKMLFCEHDKIALADRFVIGKCPYCGYEEAYGDQCDKCGAVYDTERLIDPRCKFCGESAVMKNTKHLYLKYDKIAPELDAWIESNKEIWRPHVYGEAKRWINEGLSSRAITRDIPWGIPVPLKGFENKVFYVWFDAPIGYISITKELGGQKLLDETWLNKNCEIYNFIGKDNIAFHTVFFPGTQLMAKKYNLSYNVVGFNFMNFEGQKFSKSKKIGVFCDALLTSNIDIDVLRAYLVTVFPENKDSDFKWEGFKDVANADLVGKFGNFFNRSLNMIWKNYEGKLDYELGEDLDDNDLELINAIKTYPEKIKNLLQKTEFREAYREIMNYAGIGNQYIEKTAPWTLMKNGEIEKNKKVLYLCLNLAKSLAIVAHPIIPFRTEQIWKEQLNFAGTLNDMGIWEDADKINIPKNHAIFQPKPLYARVDDEILEGYKTEFAQLLDLKKLVKG